MNPVLILTHNCLELTQKCVKSAREQDVETYIHIFDNGSTDGTIEWLEQAWCRPDYAFTWSCYDLNVPTNKGVSYGWNRLLSQFFDRRSSLDVGHVLVVNNDTIIPPWFYSSLLAYDAPFVTGISVNTIETIAAPEPRKELGPGPDFSAFLIRRDAWEKIGPFDENMKHYASDLDYHIRAHRAGVRLMNAGVPFYHERSSTLKNASPRDRREIEIQADADRITLQEKWGCRAWDASYAAMFDEKFFGVDAK